MNKIILKLKSDFILRDFLVALLISFMIVIWIQLGKGDLFVLNVLDKNRGIVYGALTSLFGALLGFIITSASIVLSYVENDKLKIVRQSIFYPKIGTAFILSIRYLAIATITSLFALLLDKDTLPKLPITELCITAVIFAITSTIRTMSIFEGIIRITTKQQKIDAIPTSYPNHVLHN